MFSNEATVDRLIEERTDARAEAFRAQERVRELEEMLYRLYVYDDNEAYHEGRKIAERRAGRAK